MEVYLIGTGGHSKQVTDILIENEYNILGAFDNFKKDITYRNIKILGNIEEIENIVPINSNLFITFGDNNYRQVIYTKFKDNYNFINCISGKSTISPTCILGYGNYIGNYTKLGEDCLIGNLNILNEGSIIGHDTIIGDFNHLSLNSSTGGNVIIGNLNLFGINSTVIPKIKIYDNNIIGANSLVIRNIKFNSTNVGIPSKII
jgi:sugar O-acyltransferase (sialic acid O-acetyltransferase NeuD family)